MQKDLVLSINKLAKEREALGYDVINGSIGMMFFDDGTLRKNQIFRETLSKHINDNDLVYSSISGENKYRDLLSKWFFNDAFDKDSTKTLATAGGAGAVFASFITENQRNENNVLLFPDIGWPNYYNIITSHHLNYIQYPLFDEKQKFNVLGDISCDQTP